jgi:hypothetical protein
MEGETFTLTSAEGRKGFCFDLVSMVVIHPFDAPLISTHF